jgi:hypothetical protein
MRAMVASVLQVASTVWLRGLAEQNDAVTLKLLNGDATGGL